MLPNDYTLLLASIRQHESFSAKPAADSGGTLVIGWGHNVFTKPLSRLQGDYLLETDISDVLQAIRLAWPFFEQLDGPRQRAVAEMGYQMGAAGLLGFHRMLRALERGDHEAAAMEALDSDLAKDTPSRAHFYAELLKSP